MRSLNLWLKSLSQQTRWTGLGNYRTIRIFRSDNAVSSSRPNVCVTETMETVLAGDYVVERSCWFQFCRFNHQHNCDVLMSLHIACRHRCVRADTCSVRNITTRVYDCCAGYGARSGSDHGFGYGRVNRHPGLRTLLTTGCTVGRLHLLLNAATHPISLS